MIETLRKSGLSADTAYAAAAVSIGLSIAIWLLNKGEDKGHAERFGIFVGLWAPTFVGIGNAIAAGEERERLSPSRTSGA